MRLGTQHTTLAVVLWLALFAAPAVVQHGLSSWWAPWGLPSLAAAFIFAVLAGTVHATRILREHVHRRAAQGATQKGPGSAVDNPDTQAEESAEEEHGAAPEEEPDQVISTALEELEPQNYMDLARALQEMNRHGEALEVLARVAEHNQGDYGQALARALRRMRRQWPQDPPAPA